MRVTRRLPLVCTVSLHRYVLHTRGCRVVQVLIQVLVHYLSQKPTVTILSSYPWGIVPLL